MWFISKEIIFYIKYKTMKFITNLNNYLTPR